MLCVGSCDSADNEHMHILFTGTLLRLQKHHIFCKARIREAFDPKKVFSAFCPITDSDAGDEAL
jgi:hypothetical protein